MVLPGRRRAIELLDVREGDHVADFACGTGLNLVGLGDHDPSRITGVDLSEPMLERARRRLPGATFLREDAARVRLPRAADRALCSYGLSLMEHRDDVLENVRGQLAPGGRLVILDFHPLRGPARLANPALAAWLRAFGVSLELGLLPRLRELFEDVRVHVPRLGYYFLVQASEARETSRGI